MQQSFKISGTVLCDRVHYKNGYHYFSALVTYGTNYWIGGKRECNSAPTNPSSFLWFDNTTIGWTKWANNTYSPSYAQQPDNGAAFGNNEQQTCIFTSSNVWFDFPCSSPQQVICQYRINESRNIM